MLFEDVYFDSLEDIFLNEESYCSIGGDSLYTECYNSTFPYDGTNSIHTWINLDDNSRSMYQYTLLRNITNNSNDHSSYLLLLSMLFIRHNSLEEVSKRGESSREYYPPINEDMLEKEYRLLSLKKGHDLALELAIPKEYTLRVNPYLHSKAYYYQMIRDIFASVEAEIYINKTPFFETIGERFAFLIYLNDMITHGYTQEVIAQSVGISPRQLRREKDTLQLLIAKVKPEDK